MDNKSCVEFNFDKGRNPRVFGYVYRLNLSLAETQKCHDDCLMIRLQYMHIANNNLNSLVVRLS